MKDYFIQTYKNTITRPGADKLLKWLEGTDFFVAPASTRYHLNRKGGLVEHSVHVYERLRELCNAETATPGFKHPESETLAIVSLLHDLCKANYYRQEMQNVKENGAWVQKPYYTVDDQFPYGHGEKSVFLIERFMKLTVEEATAIRFHMGGFEARPGDYTMQEAYKRYPLAVLLHMADMMATYLDEREG